MDRPGLKVEQCCKKILAGDRLALSHALTLLESVKPTDQQEAKKLITACLPHIGNSVRIGITGIPGVGKSTFINAFGSYLTSIGKTVAVMAIDPSSSIGKGSILGDKTRMKDLVGDRNSFVRPTPSGNKLGGVADNTKESVVLFEAAGFDIIIIETVGSGQSETDVYSLVDFFILLMQAGTGDWLQIMKKGVIELADAIIFNKSDGNNKEVTEIACKETRQIAGMFTARNNGWETKVLQCSALYMQGMEDCWQLLVEYLNLTRSNGWFDKNRNLQNKQWMKNCITKGLEQDFYQNVKVQKLMKKLYADIERDLINPLMAAEQLLDYYFSIERKKKN